MTSEVSSLGTVKPRRSRRLAIGIGLVLALLGAAGGFAVWRWGVAPPPVPPEVDWAGVDGAVKSVIQSARAEVNRAPRSADAWGRLGMALAAHGFHTESVPCFVEAERLNPAEPRWPYFQGVALQLSDPEGAIPHLRRAVELCTSGCNGPRLRLADLLAAQGRSREAEDLYLQVLAHDPQNPLAHLGLGRLAYKRNDWPDSLTRLDRAAGSPLTQKRAHTLLAEVYQRRGEAGAAERERRLEDDLPPDPDAPDSLLDELEQMQVGKQARLIRAARLLQQDQAGEAVVLLQELVRDYPDSASAWFGLGRALVQLQRYRAAVHALREAALRDPARSEIQFYLGVAHFQQGLTGPAAAFFQRAVQLRPEDAVAQYNLGQCLKTQGDRPGAIAAVREAVRYKPHYAQAHAALGELLALEGQKETALEHLRLAVDLDPTDAHARALLEKYQRK